MNLLVAGYPGTDTQKMCKELALMFGIRYVPNSLEDENVTGQQAMESMAREVQKGGFVSDCPALASTDGMTCKVFLAESRKNRARNLARREKRGVAEAMHAIEAREAALNKKLTQAGSPVLSQWEKYDLVLNKDRLSDANTAALISRYLERME